MLFVSFSYRCFDKNLGLVKVFGVKIKQGLIPRYVQYFKFYPISTICKKELFEINSQKRQDWIVLQMPSITVINGKFCTCSFLIPSRTITFVGVIHLHGVQISTSCFVWNNLRDVMTGHILYQTIHHLIHWTRSFYNAGVVSAKLRQRIC